MLTLRNTQHRNTDGEVHESANALADEIRASPKGTIHEMMSDRDEATFVEEHIHGGRKVTSGMPFSDKIVSELANHQLNERSREGDGSFTPKEQVRRGEDVGSVPLRTKQEISLDGESSAYHEKQYALKKGSAESHLEQADKHKKSLKQHVLSGLISMASKASLEIPVKAIQDLAKTHPNPIHFLLEENGLMAAATAVAMNDNFLGGKKIVSQYFLSMGLDSDHLLIAALMKRLDIHFLRGLVSDDQFLATPPGALYLQSYTGEKSEGITDKWVAVVASNRGKIPPAAYNVIKAWGKPDWYETRTYNPNPQDDDPDRWKFEGTLLGFRRILKEKESGDKVRVRKLKDGCLKNESSKDISVGPLVLWPTGIRFNTRVKEQIIQEILALPGDPLLDNAAAAYASHKASARYSSSVAGASTHTQNLHEFGDEE